jgi:hypothetical protein
VIGRSAPGQCQGEIRQGRDTIAKLAELGQRKACERAETCGSAIADALLIIDNQARKSTGRSLEIGLAASLVRHKACQREFRGIARG